MPLTPAFVSELQNILGRDGLVMSFEGRLVYECDMHTFYKGMPDAVALPTTAEQVQAIARLCRRERVPIVPRGSGTGLIGGAMAAHGGVMVSMTRMTAILDVDLPNRCAVVQPGLINLWLTNAVHDRGWFFPGRTQHAQVNFTSALIPEQGTQREVGRANEVHLYIGHFIELPLRLQGQTKRDRRRRHTNTFPVQLLYEGDCVGRQDSGAGHRFGWQRQSERLRR